ncbi:MAG: DoxX family protein [Deltaproteobacteria bacterium]|nr:DoxX family protein [Deltaproteobacteria bacterium]
MIGSILDNTTRQSAGSFGLLVLRVGTAGMMIYSHGWDKLAGFTEKSAVFPDPLGIGSAASLALATFAEFFCAIAILLGFATRVAALPLVINMLVVVLVVHGADPFAKKEFALLYAIPYITLLFAGGGKYSLDAVLWSRSRGR